MPSVSKQQQKFFGLVRALQKGDVSPSSVTKKARDAAKDMKKSDVKKYAATKHKGLPRKVKGETKVKNLIKKMVREILDEVQLDEKCQPGYMTHPTRKTKKMFGKTYRNCVKKENTAPNHDGKAAPFGSGYKKAKERKLKEGFDLKKLEDAIKMFQKKIKKQGRVTNARDEEHLEKLIKVYKEMGGKKIKEGKLSENKRQIAQTILQQLGGRRFIAMTGAKNIGFTNKGLSMKIGKNAKGITHVVVDYDRGKDLYDMEFVKIRGTKRTGKKVKSVYADDLKTIFKGYTGLRTSL